MEYINFSMLDCFGVAAKTQPSYTFCKQSIQTPSSVS